MQDRHRGLQGEHEQERRPRAGTTRDHLEQRAEPGRAEGERGLLGGDQHAAADPVLADLMRWAASWLGHLGKPLWVVADGAYAKAPFLKPMRALAVTGGVITSAGMVLAATFAALSVLPLLFLAQIAFLVGFGVLLATWGVGILIGSLIFARARHRSTAALVLASTVAVGVGYSVMLFEPGSRRPISISICPARASTATPGRAKRSRTCATSASPCSPI